MVTALFFLAETSYDRIRLVYLDEMGGIAIPMPKIFTLFSSFSLASLALPGMSGFIAELIVFCGIITSQNNNYCGNGNWNDINSYLFIIHVTSNVLWI